MSYRVRIIDTQTGEERWAQKNLDWYRKDVEDDGWGDGDRYWWTDGNYGCDCNRWLEFERAAGRDPEVDDAACTPIGKPNRYRVTHAVLDDGAEVEIDGP